MRKTIIVARSDNRVIGRQGDLPWHLPADLAFFQSLIQTGWLLTGRGSYESPQGQELFRGREDVIILTSRQNYRPASGHVAHTIPEALQLAESLGAQRLCILGGAHVYAQTIGLADELIITEVHGIFQGDAFFPEIDPAMWEELWREDHEADAENAWGYSFVRYRRKIWP